MFDFEETRSHRQPCNNHVEITERISNRVVRNNFEKKCLKHWNASLIISHVFWKKNKKERAIVKSHFPPPRALLLPVYEAPQRSTRDRQRCSAGACSRRTEGGRKKTRVFFISSPLATRTARRRKMSHILRVFPATGLHRRRRRAFLQRGKRAER